jgi:putative ABC transport system permease protein
METILQDAKYGLRQLRRHPSFSVVAILTLGLGIGVSTALFSVIDAALLRPLPYPHPDELVTIEVEEVRDAGRPSGYAPSVADIRTWRGVSSIVAHIGSGRVSGFIPLIVDTGAAQRLIVASASEDFLETYGVVPILGRSFQRDDTREGAPAVALLGHAFWQTHLGGDSSVVGRVIRIEDKPVTIIGVLPRGFYAETAVWQASRWPDASLDRRGSGTPVIARLRPGASPEQAASQLSAVTAPSTIGGPSPVPTRVVVTSMYDDETSGYSRTLRTLAWAVALIVVLSCVNVAGLLLARGATRHVELVVRASIGAGRGRLVRQLLIESLMLACAGTGVGVVLAYLSLDSLVALIPLELPANSPVAVNPTVLAFALGVTVVTAILFGLVPALKLSHGSSEQTALGVGNRGAVTPLSRRAGQWLIGVEVALALVLMSGSGLMVRSFSKLLAVDLGFDPSNLLTVEVEPLEQAAAIRNQYYPALQAALRRMPEVSAVGAIDQLALTGGGSYSFPRADTGVGVEGPQRTVLPGYLEAMGVRAIAGRLLEDGDRASGEAAIMNATGSATYFNGAALGHTLTTAGKTSRQFRIVGVVPDIRPAGPQWPVEPEMYILPDPRPETTARSTLAMVIRLRGGRSLGPERLRQIAESIGSRVLVGRVRPAADLLGQQVATPRHRMLLLTLLGSFGLVLTLVGISSVTAYAVARRTREIGVRVAFGARPVDVVRTIARDAGWPVALGLVAGLAGTYYAMRVIASFLFQTPEHDPATLAYVAVLLGAAACLAAWLPARRAASVDPVAALRAE